MDIKPNNLQNNYQNQKMSESWDDSDLGDLAHHDSPKKTMSFSIKFFLVSFGIFILAAVFVVYSFMRNSSSFSANDINFNISGSASLPSGEPGSINLSIANKNNVSIDSAYVIVQYDSGENVSGAKNLVSQKIDLGEIVSGGVQNKSISVTLFGNEGSAREIIATLFYKIEGSNAEFNKTTNPLNVLLKSSPVIISIDSLSEFRQNNINTFNLTIKNNTPKDIKNLIISVRTPKDFIYSSSSNPLYNNNPSWLVGTLSANSQKQISFSGKLTGDIGETAQFTFYAGTPKTNSTTSSSTLGNYDNFNLSLDNIYSQLEKSILISGQYLDISITGDSTNGSQKVSPGELITLDFTYKNNLNYPLDNLVITAKLSGNGIDESSTQAVQGIYDKDLNNAVWNKATLSSLSQVGANSTGKFRLQIRTVKSLTGDNIIRLQVFAKGERNSEKDVSNEQNMSFERVWTVGSN